MRARGKAPWSAGARAAATAEPVPKTFVRPGTRSSAARSGGRQPLIHLLLVRAQPLLGYGGGVLLVDVNAA